MKLKIADRTEIANRIRQLRGLLTQREFAEKIGVQQQIVSFVENGTMPGADILILISEKCGVSIDWLLTGKAKDAIESDRVREVEAEYRQDMPSRQVHRAIQDLTPAETTDLLDYIKLIKKRRGT